MTYLEGNSRGFKSDAVGGRMVSRAAVHFKIECTQPLLSHRALVSRLKMVSCGLHVVPVAFLQDPLSKLVCRLITPGPPPPGQNSKAMAVVSLDCCTRPWAGRRNRLLDMSRPFGQTLLGSIAH